jgi:hypothetical protein
MCKATLADGTPYEHWQRIFVTEWNGQTVYAWVEGYYRPGSGEFFWRSTGYSEKGYNDIKPNFKTADPCKETYPHALFLQDGEWADFWAENGSITVFHCNLRFDSRQKAWSHVTEHWRELDSFSDSNTKWVEVILLYKQLGSEFFRPKRLEFDARAFFYNSLGRVKKVGSNWELEINGADEPNRAMVLLDSSFKLLAVTKNSATH